MGEVEDDFLFALLDELVEGVAELSGLVAQGDASGDVDNGYVAYFAGGYGHWVWSGFGFRLRVSGLGGW